ncbi:AraC family transcriptional regulator [Sporosarcina sp. ACRSL]|uniref:helix-turn-helix domain-containing protein n=1 Tax=Sporosarcina sp. ACRSL TaxID=2918215 RepID=UPI001EF6A298|nr:AraC family transcriptional regulator [Sporosarcina sp. ACRSL]MCG7345892.1 AraC family transcriptional regulator [Sporosarcina sp. ACRSL]
MSVKETSNFILHAKSNEFYWEGNGQLSIKTFSNGKALYKADRGFFAVEENRYLLLNEGPYTIGIEEKQDVESFCMFFGSGFAEDVYRTLDASTNDLLTDPYKTTSPLNFFERTYAISPSLAGQINTLKKHHKQLDACWHDEQFHRIMETLIVEQLSTLREVESLQALRKSTREELFQRVTTANEYIRAFFAEPLQLTDIAKVACLSQNHLLRSYSQVFGKTPHQHISELRIEKAKKLLANFELNMTDIAFEIGFLNPVSFSKMFKQHMGMSPLHYRKKVILDKKSY